MRQRQGDASDAPGRTRGLEVMVGFSLEPTRKRSPTARRGSTGTTCVSNLCAARRPLILKLVDGVSRSSDVCDSALARMTLDRRSALRSSTNRGMTIVAIRTSPVTLGSQTVRTDIRSPAPPHQPPTVPKSAPALKEALTDAATNPRVFVSLPMLPAGGGGCGGGRARDQPDELRFAGRSRCATGPARPAAACSSPPSSHRHARRVIWSALDPLAFRARLRPAKLFDKKKQDTAVGSRSRAQVVALGAAVAADVARGCQHEVTCSTSVPLRLGIEMRAGWSRS